MKSRFLKILGIGFCLLITFSSCDNFLIGAETRLQLEKAIAYNNAPSYTLYVDCPESSGVIRSPAGGEVNKKISDKFSIRFDTFTEYEFISWKIIDKTTGKEYKNGEYITLENVDQSETSCTFTKEPAYKMKLCLTPVVAERPQIISNSPLTSGTIKDSSIQVLFDYNMDPYSIYYTKDEITALKESGITEEDFLSTFVEDEADAQKKYYGYKKDDKVYFKNINIKNNMTGESLNNSFGIPVFENERTLSIPVVNKTALEDFTQVLVTIEKGFFYTVKTEGQDKGKSVEMAGSKRWMYQVGDQTDSKPLRIATSNNEDMCTVRLVDTEETVIPRTKTIFETTENINIKDLKFVKNNNLYIDLRVQEPESGSGPASYFELYATKIFDENYGLLFQFDGEKTGVKYYGNPMQINYQAVTSDIGVFKGMVDLSQFYLGSGVYQLYFKFYDRSGNWEVYPSRPELSQDFLNEIIRRAQDGEDIRYLLEEYDQILEKYKNYYYAIDNDIYMPEPVITDTSNSSGANLKLSWEPCTDFEKAEIRYKAEGEDWTSIDTIERDRNFKEYYGLDLATNYEFEVTYYDFAGNSRTYNVSQKTTDCCITVQVDDSLLKTVYLQGDSFDTSGITVKLIDLRNGAQTSLEYGSSDGWTTDFETTWVCFDKVVNVFYTYEGQTLSTAIGQGYTPILYYVANAHALTRSPIKVNDDYSGSLDVLSNAGKEVSYYRFGDFPQTISHYTDEMRGYEESNKGLTAEPVYNGWYLSKEDGYFYERCLEGPSGESEGAMYSNGEYLKEKNSGIQFNYRYFKVEPIIWGVITDDYDGKTLLLSEKVLTSQCFYANGHPRQIEGEEIEPNNYEWSTINAYLNGLSYLRSDGDPYNCTQVDEFDGKGFLQQAFTQETREEYFDKTKRTKLFLLSEDEIQDSSWWTTASEYHKYALQRMPTDYALANCTICKHTDEWLNEEKLTSPWWLSTPQKNNENEDILVNYIGINGIIDTRDFSYCFGVVPALVISELPE